MSTKMIAGYGWLVSLLFVLSVSLAGGCESDAQTGALVGVGVGALIGQAAGGSTEATLIGAGVGAGAGYMIGNEKDKKKAQQQNYNVQYSTAESPLAGTSWLVLSVVPEPKVHFKSMTVTFGSDGYVKTSKILSDGKLIQAAERYRTVGKTLIVNRPGYIINAEFVIDRDQLIIDCEQFRGVLMRVGS